jgi:hypothetical protein
VSVAVDAPPAAPLPAPLAPVARGQILAAAATSFVLLAATSARYGYFRDELYFRMLKPGWGYVDQPPLTPLLARVATRLLGDHVWAMRLPAALCVAGAIWMTALIAREIGANKQGQVLAAWGSAFSGFYLVSGHILLTSTVDLLMWSSVMYCMVRALQRQAPQWWLWAGVLVGVSLYNKLLIVLLLIGLLIGLIAVGPRRELRSPWLWGGVAIALVIGSPNIIYQATHNWPQWTMAGVISDHKGGEARIELIPFQLFLIGIPFVALIGLIAMLRGERFRRVRALAVAYLVVLAIVLVTGGQAYYPFGLLTVLFAAGCVGWGDSLVGRPMRQRPATVAALAISAAFTLMIALPLLPVTVVGHTPILVINQGMRDEIGWPAYVARVADAYRGLSAADRQRAMLYASNYGEAGAVTKFGPALGLPGVYSGQNQLWYLGPPPEGATVVVAWTENLTGLRTHFASCQQTATQDDGVGADNEEQGSAVAVCRDPIGGWATVWPQLQHFD